MPGEPNRVMSYAKIQEMVDLETKWERKLSLAHKKAAKIEQDSSSQITQQVREIIENAKKQVQQMHEQSSLEIQTKCEQILTQASKKATNFNLEQEQVDAIAMQIVSDIERFLV